MRLLFCSLILALACILFAPSATAWANPPRYRSYYTPVVPYTAPRVVSPGVYRYPQVNTTAGYWNSPSLWYGYGSYGYPYPYGRYYYPGSYSYWATPAGSGYYYINPGYYYWYRW